MVVVMVGVTATLVPKPGNREQPAVAGNAVCVVENINNEL